MLVIGNEELVGRPAFKKGDLIRRDADGKVFPVKVGTNPETGKESTTLGFIEDGEQSFLVGVGGSLLAGWEHAPTDNANVEGEQS